MIKIVLDPQIILMAKNIVKNFVKNGNFQSEIEDGTVSLQSSPSENAENLVFLEFFAILGQP